MNFLWLLLVVVTAATLGVVAAENLELLILHNNDMHARYEETSKISGTCKPSHRNKSCIGGFARLVHMVKKYRKEAETGTGRKVIFLNAGDTYTGTAWHSVHRYKIVAEFMNILKPDAVSFGNHEFDDGVAGLVPYVNAAGFPIVAANLDFSNEPSLKATNVTKSVVLDVSGRKIGVIGYLTPDTKLISQTESVIFFPEVDSIKKESEKLDSQGVKIIIAVGHSGFDMDKNIAKNVPLVDVVIGGHTNTFLWNGPPPDAEKPEDVYPVVVAQKGGKKVPVVQAYAYTKYLGRLNVTFDEEGNAVEFFGQPLLMSSDIPQDPFVMQTLDKYRAQLKEIEAEVLGKTKVLLDGSTENCRFRECNFGNLIADSMVAYHLMSYSGVQWTDAPIALVNGGSIRHTIDPATAEGNVTRKELLNALPYENQVFTITMNGSDLWKTLELSVRSNGETSRGEFLQVSGLRVTYDLSKEVGARVVSVRVRCGNCSYPVYNELDKGKSYRVVTTSFLTSGGDGHYLLKDKTYNKLQEDLSDLEIVAWYLGRTSPVYPELQDRISFVGTTGKGGAGVCLASISLSFISLLVPVLLR